MTDLQVELNSWYLSNKRNLPWRNTNDPYFVWLSEIILQQTRVEQGLPYYNRFISKYPTVFKLAEASENDILLDWQGLGYYSRARNLHQTAKIIVNNYNGIFPDRFQELLKLKGVGRYTAAAIASFCYNEKVAVVDGNVFRVLSRLYDLDLPINVSKNLAFFEKLANELLFKENPGLFNQAIMEFGALQCKPVAPDCSLCPLILFCHSYKNQTIGNRPVKVKKQAIKNRFFVYFDVIKKGGTYLRQRKEDDIWKNMYEFPVIECYSEEEYKKYLDNFSSNSSKSFKHILSHQHIFATFVSVPELPSEIKENTLWVKKEDLSEFPLHRLVTKYLESKNV